MKNWGELKRGDIIYLNYNLEKGCLDLIAPFRIVKLQENFKKDISHRRISTGTLFYLEDMNKVLSEVNPTIYVEKSLLNTDSEIDYVDSGRKNDIFFFYPSKEPLLSILEDRIASEEIRLEAVQKDLNELKETYENFKLN